MMNWALCFAILQIELIQESILLTGLNGKLINLTSSNYEKFNRSLVVLGFNSNYDRSCMVYPFRYSKRQL